MGCPIFVAADQHSSTKVQRWDNCFVVKTSFHWESKALINDCFKVCFDFVNQLSNHGLPESQFGPAIKPFKISAPQDLLSFWKTLDMGGACKVKNYVCHYCTCHSLHCVDYKTGNNWCTQCQQRSWEHCFHHEVCDNALLAEYWEQLHWLLKQNVEPHYEHYERIKNLSKIWTNPNKAGAKDNPLHIEFICPPNGVLRNQFASWLNMELIIQQPNWSWHVAEMSLEDKHEFLLDLIDVEDKVLSKKAAIEQDRASNSMLLLEHAILCILHCENHWGEKIVHLLLLEGFAKASSKSPAEREEFLMHVQCYVNTHITGDENVPGNGSFQWAMTERLWFQWHWPIH